MRAHLLTAVALTAALAVVGVSGCSHLQEEHACPGPGCTPALEALAEQVAALPLVTHVRRTAWSSGLDDGVAGRVEVVAVGTTRADAEGLAARIVELYLDADIEAPNLIEVEVAPDPRQQFGSGVGYSFWATNANWRRIRMR
jgi:hypothetical protein